MKRSSEKSKMYVIRKYVKATDVKQALRKEPTTPVHDLFIKEDWADKELASCIGFDNGVDQEQELED